MAQTPFANLCMVQIQVGKIDHTYLINQIRSFFIVEQTILYLLAFGHLDLTREDIVINSMFARYA